jgi:hypothetical protein
MALFVMQEEERAAAQNFAGAPNHAPWKQIVAEYRLPVSIHVGGRRDRLAFLGFWFPQPGGPARQRIAERLSAARLRDLRKKSFDGAIAIRPASSGEEC